MYRGPRGYEPLYWSEWARGSVLEVGLGNGVLAHAIQAKGRAGCHHIVEVDEETATAVAVPGAKIILGAFPDVELPLARYETILLDIPGARDHRVVGRALDLLADGGVLGLRR